MSGVVRGTARTSVPAGHGGGDGATLRSGRLVRILVHDPFVVAVLALDALILAFRPSLQLRSDTWLALVSGRLVWSDWLPHHDALTVWADGRTWIDQQWLGQLFFYWIHALGGLRLLLIVHVAILVTGFGLALAFARRAGGSSRSVALVGMVGLFVALPNSVARTQTFAVVLFVALFWLLASSARTGSRRFLLALPLLVLWANIHGSAVLGAGLVALWAIARASTAGKRRDRTAWLVRARAALIGVAAPLCLLVSPYGPSVVGYYRDIFGASAFRDLVGEWGPSDFPAQLPFFALAVVALWLVARKPGRLTLFEHLALLCTLFAAFDAVRNIVWFALVVVMVVPRALDEVWPVEEVPIRRQVNIALSLGALAMMVGALAIGASHPGSWYTKRYPADAAAAVSRATSDPSVHVLPNEAFADWLLWDLPELSGRVAYDARFELLTSEELHAIAHFRGRSSPNWLAAADGYRLLVLDPRDDRRAIRAVLREPGTRRIYRSRHVVVLFRAAPA